MDGILSLNASLWEKANLARLDSLGAADSLVLDCH